MHKINKFRNQSGLTLIETLAAIAIFTTVSTIFIGVFLQAFDYVKGNQDKTVGIQAARNAVLYMERQDFNDVKKYSGQSLTTSNCGTYSSAPHPIFTSIQQCKAILSPSINNVTYRIEVRVEPFTPNDFGTLKGTNHSLKNIEQRNFSDLIIKTLVSIDWKEAENARQSSTITGFVVSDKLR